MSCPNTPEIELTNINKEAVVTIIFGFSALSKKRIGLRNIPPPIPTIPEINPRTEPITKEIKKCNFLIIKLYLNIKNISTAYFKKIIKPSSEEIEKHEEYINKNLKKNFFN